MEQDEARASLDEQIDISEMVTEPPSDVVPSWLDEG